MFRCCGHFIWQYIMPTQAEGTYAKVPVQRTHLHFNKCLFTLYLLKNLQCGERYVTFYIFPKMEINGNFAL